MVKMKISKIDLVIRTLKEMRLNYKSQYPMKVPDMDFVVKIVEKEVNNLKVI